MAKCKALTGLAVKVLIKMVELWFKIMQIGCLALKAHRKIMCSNPHK